MSNGKKPLSEDSSLFASPLVQAGLLGTAAYFGSRGLYNWLSENPAYQSYINSIQDPYQRMLAERQFREHRDRIGGRISKGAALVGAAIPLMLNRNTLKEGWSEGAGASGTPGTPGIAGGVSGALASAVGGERAVKGMRMLRERQERDRQTYLGKDSSEKSYIYDFLEKVGSEYDDAFAGKDFKLPFVRPLSTAALSDIPVASSIASIATPNNAQIMGYDNAYKIIGGFNNASGGLGAGMISTIDLTKGLVRAGFGAVKGSVTANVLGTLLAQPPQVKRQLERYGAIGGAILNLGIFK